MGTKVEIELVCGRDDECLDADRKRQHLWFKVDCAAR